MHRSGTSAVTRVLGLRGAALPRKFVPTAPDNETGFWEPADIVAVHDEILESAACSWADIGEFPAAWFNSDVADKFARRLTTAVENEYGDAPLFVVKDPRLCRLVPLWLDLLADMGITPLFVLPIRNPLEVAASLKKRDSFQTETSLLLWLRYFLAAERATRHHQRSLISYDRLLTNWRGTVDQIGEDLAVSWPRQSYAADNEIAQFLSTELRHHSVLDREILAREHIAVWVKNAFAWALRAVDQKPADTRDLDAIHADLLEADQAFMPIVLHREALASTLSNDVKQLTAKTADQTDQYDQLAEQHRQLADQYRQLCDQHNRLEDKSSQIEERHRQLSQEYEHERTLSRIQESQINDLRIQARREQEAVLRAGSQVAELQQKLDVQDAELQVLPQLRMELNAIQQSFAALRVQHDLLASSTIWRMSAPIRSVGDAIPTPMRLRMRRAAKLFYWAITPGKTRQRIAFVRRRKANAAVQVQDLPAAPSATEVGVNEDDPLLTVAKNAAAKAMGNVADLGQHRVCVGIVVHKQDVDDVRRLIVSAMSAVVRCGDDVSGEIRVLDNGGTLADADVPEPAIFHSSKNEGFGAGHNHCMNVAFENGATVYIAANPDGRFHPDCIKHLLAMHHAQHGHALIEARQFPEEHPKYYDPADLSTAWVSGACLLIPESIWRKTGGFDPNLFLYCEDVDLSWTARAMGFRTLMCPAALFWHDVSGRAHEPWRWREMLLSGRYLAHKWRNSDFQSWAENRLLEDGFASHKDELPPVDDLPTAPKPDGIADFTYSFHFAPVRW